MKKKEEKNKIRKPEEKMKQGLTYRISHVIMSHERSVLCDIVHL